MHQDCAIIVINIAKQMTVCAMKPKKRNFCLSLRKLPNTIKANGTT